MAQTFKAGFTQTLDGIELTHDTWSGNLVDVDIALYRVTAADAPTGDLLAHLHLTPVNGPGLIDFTPYHVSLDAGQTYALVLSSGWGNVNGVAFNPGHHDADWNYTDSYASGMLWSSSKGSAAGRRWPGGRRRAASWQERTRGLKEPARGRPPAPPVSCSGSPGPRRPSRPS